MAIQLGIKITLSEDKRFITIQDEGSFWGGGINSSEDLTSLRVIVMGEDKNNILYNILLTTIEKNSFDSGIVLNFDDIRWFNTEYAPDNYYVVYLVGDDIYESDWEAFELHLALSTQVHVNNSTVNLRPQNLFRLENNIQSVIALDSMENLANDRYSPDREYRWRKLYDYIQDNIINKY